MSTKEAVAQTLGAHVATSTPAAEIWHGVAHGQVPLEAAASLLEREGVDVAEREAFERARALFAPVPAERRQEQLEALLARRRAEDDAVVVPMRPRRARRWAAGLLAAAAAVVLTVWLVPPRGPADDRGTFVGGYEIVLDNAAATMRGTASPAEVPTFRLDDALRIRLVPEQAVEGPLGVAVFAWDRASQVRRLEVVPRVHERGVVELETTVKALGLGEGEWELVIVIGWAEALPSSWEELAESPDPASRGYEVARRRVRVVARL